MLNAMYTGIDRARPHHNNNNHSHEHPSERVKKYKVRHHKKSVDRARTGFEPMTSPTQTERDNLFPNAPFTVQETWCAMAMVILAIWSLRRVAVAVVVLR